MKPANIVNATRIKLAIMKIVVTVPMVATRS